MSMLTGHDGRNKHRKPLAQHTVWYRARCSLSCTYKLMATFTGVGRDILRGDRDTLEMTHFFPEKSWRRHSILPQTTMQSTPRGTCACQFRSVLILYLLAFPLICTRCWEHVSMELLGDIIIRFDPQMVVEHKRCTGEKVKMTSFGWSWREPLEMEPRIV